MPEMRLAIDVVNGRRDVKLLAHAGDTLENKQGLGNRPNELNAVLSGDSGKPSSALSFRRDLKAKSSGFKRSRKGKMPQR